MSRWQRTIAALVLILAMGVTHLGVNVPSAAAATATSFTPATVSSLPSTITITTAGVNADTTTASMTLVFPTSLSISNLQCVGIFQGASAVAGPVQAGPSAGTSQQSLGCALMGATRVSGTSGNVQSFTLSGTGSGQVSFLTTGPNASMFVHSDLSTEGIGTAGTLSLGATPVTGTPATGTSTPAAM